MAYHWVWPGLQTHMFYLFPELSFVIPLGAPHSFSTAAFPTTDKCKTKGILNKLSLQKNTPMGTTDVAGLVKVHVCRAVLGELVGD